MTRIAFVADTHLANFNRFGGKERDGLNDRCRMTIEVFENAVHAAGKKKCAAFVVAGDLFDSDKPPPPLIAEVQRVCSIARKTYRMEPILLVGNHDQHTSGLGDNALAPLQDHAVVIGSPQIYSIKGVTLLCLPFQPEPVEAWLASTVERLTIGAGGWLVQLVAAHFGLSDHTTAPFLIGSRDSVDVKIALDVVKKNKLRGIVVGNWHDHKTWHEKDAFAIQCGTLCPTGWKDPGLEDYGLVTFYESETNAVTYEEIPGPRFVKLYNTDAVKKAQARATEMGHRLFVSLSVADDEIAATRDFMAGAKVEACEVLSDGIDAKAAASEAARETRKAETADQAAAAFVGSMHLEPTVSRANVLARTLRYMQ
jgi:hypothetical protein